MNEHPQKSPATVPHALPRAASCGDPATVPHALPRAASCGAPATVPHALSRAASCGDPATVPHALSRAASCGAPATVPHALPRAASCGAWFLLFRPWSYTATLVPFLFALALTGSTAPHGLARWAIGLLSGILFQATVNLLNTWGDECSGVDNVPGAIRTTPQVHEGLVSMRAVLAVGLSCAALAAALGVGLVFHQGPCWSLLAAGILGALGSTNYSTGIKFKYRGLGVPFVALLMGPLEVFVASAILDPSRADDFMLALLRWTSFDWFTVVAFLFVTFPIAALVCIIMHGNDMRDIPTDRAAGIRTVASVLGPRRALWFYWFCHVGAYLPPLAMFVYDRFFGCCDFQSFYYLLPLLALPLTARTLHVATRTYRENPECPKWRGLERGSGGIHFLFGLLYSLTFYLTLA